MTGVRVWWRNRVEEEAVVRHVARVYCRSYSEYVRGVMLGWHGNQRKRAMEEMDGRLWRMSLDPSP